MDVEDMWEENVCVELEGRPYYPPMNWITGGPSWAVTGSTTLSGATFSVNSGTVTFNSAAIPSYTTGISSTGYACSWKRGP